MPRIQQKRGTSANLAAVNPTPLSGEIVWESDTNRLKVGDGATAYISLPYAGGVADGDKGDIVVSASGATWSIDSGVLSTFGRSLIDDADAATARATLGAAPTDTPVFTGSVTLPNGSVSAPSMLLSTTDTDTGVYWVQENTVGITCGGVQRLAVSGTAFVVGSARVLVGTSTSRTAGPATHPALQFEGVNAGAVSYQCICGSTTATVSPQIILARHRGAVGESTLVASGDSLGLIRWNGGDGTDCVSTAAQIECVVDGTPGADDMPGSLRFSTASDGAATATERMRIDSSGRVGIGTTGPSSTLHVNGTIRATNLTDGTTTKTITEVLGSAAASHTHSASDIVSGTIATARLGSGTANSTTFLRGDGSWATPAGGGGVTDGDKGDIVVSSSGATWSIDSGVLSTLGRTLISQTTAANMRSTLGFSTNIVFGDGASADLISAFASGQTYSAFAATLTPDDAAIGARALKAVGDGSSTFVISSLVGGAWKVGTATINEVQLCTNNAARLFIGTANVYTSNANIGVRTSSPTAALDVNQNTIRLRTARTPASATATGNTGDICWDSSYLYVCIATNTWRRIAHSTW